MKYLFVSLLTLFSAFCYANEKKILAGVVLFPPNVHIDDDGNCKGSLHENLQSLFKDSSFDLTIECMTPLRIYRDIADKSLDFTVNVKTTNALNELVSYSNVPYLKLHIVKARNPLATEKNTVSVLRGFDYNGNTRKLIASGISPIESNSVDIVMKIFFKGRTEYLLAYRGPFLHFKKQYLTKGKRFENLEVELIESIDSYIAISKRSRFHDELLEYVNLNWKAPVN